MSVAYAAHPSSFRRGTSFLRRANDERLLQLARRGDEVAFSTLFYRYQRPIVSYCTHLMGNQSDGEDAAQYVFYALQQEIQNSERSLLVRPWLYRVAHNRCISALRVRREADPLPEFDADVFALTANCASEEVQQREEVDDLVREVRTLPDDQRSALLLTQFSGLSCEEAAGILQCSSPRLRALVFQARKRLLDSRNAQELSCQKVQEELSVAHSRLKGDLRRHVTACSSCHDFHRKIKMQRKALAALLPVLPSKAFLTGFGFSKTSTITGKFLCWVSGRSARVVTVVKLTAPLAVLPITILPVMHSLPNKEHVIGQQNERKKHYEAGYGQALSLVEKKQAGIQVAQNALPSFDSHPASSHDKGWIYPANSLKPSTGSITQEPASTSTAQESTTDTQQIVSRPGSSSELNIKSGSDNDDDSKDSQDSPSVALVPPSKDPSTSPSSKPQSSEDEKKNGSATPSSGSGSERSTPSGCVRIDGRSCYGDPKPGIKPPIKDGPEERPSGESSPPSTEPIPAPAPAPRGPEVREP